MALHIGEKIRQRSKELRIGPTELGRLINTSKQNVYGIYKRKSVDTELLQKISKALNYDFFQYYYTENLSVVSEALPFYGKKTKDVISIEDIVIMKRELDDLREKYELLKKVNALLEKEKEKAKPKNK